MKANVVSAIFRRNLLSYFSNPTGYVFICLFVVLCSAFTYWPFEFFNANLANLDQLNRYLPYILLIFIPAITMGIWADERRQGTDELLLTLPATDFEVVLGKYLAAVGVFSVSLLFSAMCNLAMLQFLGHPDFFLVAVNYFGYWLVGLAMLATGMVASFLTSNLTVAFILGVVFNTPLVAADWADAFAGSPAWALTIKHWGLPEQFRDFGRGVVSFGSTIYFLMLVVVMLYLCMVLIGRRHWMGGRDGSSLFGHYLCRALALIVIAASLNMVVEAFDFRYDATAEKISSLSPESIALLDKVTAKNRLITIEAYISPSVPENYVLTRLNLLTALHEIEKRGHGAIQVKIINAEPATADATTAEQQYGIKPQQVRAESRGTASEDQIFLGVAVRSGLEKVVIPFFDQGMPIEYELVRAIATVAQEKRKRLGVVKSDAELFGGFEMDMMNGPRSRPRQPIIGELEKQYEVVQVDASKPIEKFDVLMVVQPSSLAQPQLDNLVKAIKHGQPTAIFEDPFPAFMAGVPGTNDEKRGNPMTGQPPAAKGDIQDLWDLLGVRMVGPQRVASGVGMPPPSASVIWQDWLPYHKISPKLIPREFVFIGQDMPGKADGFNEKDPITSGLKELWFPFPGAFTNLNASKTKFVDLVSTGTTTGTIQPDVFKRPGETQDTVAREENKNATGRSYVLAAHITGDVETLDPPAADQKDDKAAKDAGAKKEDAKAGEDKAADALKKKPVAKTHALNVVLVADIDLMDSRVFDIRAESDEMDIGVHFDNIVFVVNALDALCDDDRFIEIRKRKPAHRTLTTLDDKQTEFRKKLVDEENKFEEEYDKNKKDADLQRDLAVQKMNDIKAQIDEKRASGASEIPPDLRIKFTEAQLNAAIEDQHVKDKDDQLERDEKRNLDAANRDFNTDMRHEQNWYKFLAVLLPPIPPFLVAIFVFFRRRAEEREGVAKSRLR